MLVYQRVYIYIYVDVYIILYNITSSVYTWNHQHPSSSTNIRHHPPTKNFFKHPTLWEAFGSSHIACWCTCSGFASTSWRDQHDMFLSNALNMFNSLKQFQTKQNQLNQLGFSHWNFNFQVQTRKASAAPPEGIFLALFHFGQCCSTVGGPSNLPRGDPKTETIGISD
jgi:hypothetical protein